MRRTAEKAAASFRYPERERLSRHGSTAARAIGPGPSVRGTASLPDGLGVHVLLQPGGEIRHGTWRPGPRRSAGGRRRSGFPYPGRPPPAYRGSSPGWPPGSSCRSSRCGSSTSTRKPAPSSCFAIWSAYSRARSVMGRTFTCTGFSHTGKAPAKCSVMTPMNRSMEPSTTRWIMTGRCFWPSSPMYSSSNRSGSWLSSWMVPHCQVRPRESARWKSSLGP